MGEQTDKGKSARAWKARVVLVGLHGRHQTGWDEQTVKPIWKILPKRLMLKNPRHGQTQCIWDARRKKQKADYRAVQARIEWFRTLTTTGGSEGNVIANKSNSSRRITARTTPQEATPINVLRIIANSEERCIFSPVKGNSVCGGSLSPPEGFEVEEELL